MDEIYRHIEKSQLKVLQLKIDTISRRLLELEFQ